MTLKRHPDLQAFLATYFADADPDRDIDTTRAFVAASSADRQSQLIVQIKLLITDANLSVEEIGNEANRWFAEADEARAWLRQILSILEGAQTSDVIVVKDSNGTVLSEGDSVQVIKDLKVKGGSSDLKRGTMIRKIHLIDDPEAIECRVDGSTLVLKACFLKKA